ncbi:MAG: sugar phosphate isomerase/epimerase, partial [Xanthomonadales bacterium]|nr:sugar phosphate isomerase/epimerase [Xanthomonadales bacterium]
AGSVLAGGQAGIELPGLHLFSKHLQFLDYRAMAEAAARLGFAGLDLTVRPGGHVEPDNFKRDLPAAISAIKGAGLECTMMTTSINSTKNPCHRELLELARSLGVESYRTGWLKYDYEVEPMALVEHYRGQLAALAEWNRELGITGMYQNHSGEGSFGASIWDIYLAIRDLDPDALGMQFDIRHAVTEGGRKWPDSFRLLRPHIRSLAIKDFKWARLDGKWQLVNTPMGQGMVDFKRYFRMLKDAGLNYPISLHCEYDLGGANQGKRELTKPASEVLAAIRKDVDTVRSLWAEA